MLIQGNSIHIPLKDKSVHCVITSPPYYGLRDYGIGGQLGLEPTLQEYIDNTVLWAREVHRVLRDDGTFWLNMGDSYNGSGAKDNQVNSPKQMTNRGGKSQRGTNDAQLKPKDLMGVPWRVALALQEDGWYLRSDVIWMKPNPMPESVTDRPTKSHEYVFLLTKSGESLFWTHPEKRGVREKPIPDYVYTHKETGEETKEQPSGDWKEEWKRRNLWRGHDYYYDADAVREEYTEPMNRWGGEKLVAKGTSSWDGGTGQVTYRDRDMRPNKAGRNKRTVWTITTKPYPGAHFATFPPELPEICIKAGTSEKGVCPVCGAGWVRETIKETTFEGGSGKAGRLPEDIDGKWGDKRYGKNILLGPVNTVETIGWKPTCDHNEEPIPATVLDPFAGSGTTVMVANALGRKGIGIDLSWSYLQLARERTGIKAIGEWLNGKKVEANWEDLPMFQEADDLP